MKNNFCRMVFIVAMVFPCFFSCSCNSTPDTEPTESQASYLLHASWDDGTVFINTLTMTMEGQDQIKSDEGVMELQTRQVRESKSIVEISSTEDNLPAEFTIKNIVSRLTITRLDTDESASRDQESQGGIVRGIRHGAGYEFYRQVGEKWQPVEDKFNLFVFEEALLPKDKVWEGKTWDADTESLEAIFAAKKTNMNFSRIECRLASVDEKTGDCEVETRWIQAGEFADSYRIEIRLKGKYIFNLKLKKMTRLELDGFQTFEDTEKGSTLKNILLLRLERNFDREAGTALMKSTADNPPDSSDNNPSGQKPDKWWKTD